MSEEFKKVKGIIEAYKKNADLDNEVVEDYIVINNNGEWLDIEAHSYEITTRSLRLHEQHTLWHYRFYETHLCHKNNEEPLFVFNFDYVLCVLNKKNFLRLSMRSSFFNETFYSIIFKDSSINPVNVVCSFYDIETSEDKENTSYEFYESIDDKIKTVGSFNYSKIAYVRKVKKHEK